MPPRLSTIAVLLVAGCASAPRSAFPPIANMHSPTLCYVQYAGNVAEIQASTAELEARRFTCTDAARYEGRQQFLTMQGHQQQLDLQQRQHDGSGAAALGLGILLLNGSTAAPPRPVTCQTTPNRQTTVCN
jgi:hypothetical protein